VSLLTSSENIAPGELLGRTDIAVHSDAAIAALTDRKILVTGAGGSIGSELVRQLYQLNPGKIYMLDHDENALHGVQLELTGNGLLDDETTILADIRDNRAMNRIMSRIRPEVVFHAAAHKHLPLLERFPIEGLMTNVIGTSNVLTSAIACGAESFINVSTDKAARPTSVLGATKRLAELLVGHHSDLGTRIASVRFGNVLGSHGSFLHSLAHQVRNGLPITITHPEVTRYFMTIPEASSLVIEASLMARRGEIYVLDMGEPVRIVELVERFLVATNSEDRTISYTGLRQGEKLHEALYQADEIQVATAHEKIRCTTSISHPSSDVYGLAMDLMAAPESTDPMLFRNQLFMLLNEIGADGSRSDHTKEIIHHRPELVA
jgi:FlaA1/EpsC-like NDP-sugar epimerase